MAKHFKEDAAESTAVMNSRKLKATKKRVDTSGGTGYLPYGQAASYRASYADAAPTGEFFMDDLPARGGIYAFLRGVLLLLAWVMRIVALGFMFLVVANVLSLPFFRAQLTWITDLITSYLPWRNIGLLAVDTPFGGTFRGDLSLISLAFFIVDWLLCRLRASLR